MIAEPKQADWCELEKQMQRVKSLAETLHVERGKLEQLIQRVQEREQWPQVKGAGSQEG